MGKHSRCVTGICDNELHKKAQQCGDNMQILPKDGATRTAWIKAMLRVRKL